MAWVVDTCLVLDVLEHDPLHGSTTAALLDAHAEVGLVLCPVSYIELAPAFLGDTHRQGEFLDRVGIDYQQPWTWEDTNRAHQGWNAHVIRRREQQAGRRPVADVLIGAFAFRFHGLLTRNAGDFKISLPQTTDRRSSLSAVLCQRRPDDEHSPMHPHLFSILIAGYKDTVCQTLDGVLALQQSATATFEVILLDNTRDSRHRAMAENAFAAAPPNVRTVYLAHPVPGKAQAQNRGIAEARGEFLVFLDDDVLPDPHLILAYEEAFRAHPECAAVQGRVALQFEDGAQAPSWFNERFRLDLAEMDFGRAIVPFEMGLTGANMAFRASLFRTYGGFDERLGPGRSGTLEDQEFSERIRARGEIQLFWPGASVRHRIPPARLRFRAFARIYFDVGYSDFFLSGHHIKGGRGRFTLYTIKQWLMRIPRLLAAAVCLRTPDFLHTLCEACRTYGYWRQGLKQLGAPPHPSPPS